MQDPLENHIYKGDCLEWMREWPDNVFDHCITDPPFNISKKSGLGWAFSSHITMQEKWDNFSKDGFFEFNVAWLEQACRLVKPNGNIFVFGTYHNIYQIGFILQNILKRHIVNSIIWLKPNAQPNITGRTLTESTEQIIWAVNETPEKARGWTFNYWKAKELNEDKQMRNYWEIPVVRPSERKFGHHPSQKPVALTDRIIMLATITEENLLDPFGGAGTLALSAIKLRRNYTLIESNPQYVEIAEERILDLKRSPFSNLPKSLADEDISIITEVPVPQADSLEHVLEVPQFVVDGADTRNGVAERLAYVGRQGPYYADAALALRLVYTAGVRGSTGQKFQVTELGERLVNRSPSDRKLLEKEIVLGAPIVKYILAKVENSSRMSNEQKLLGLVEDHEFVARIIEDLGLSPNTARRRTTTIVNWIRQAWDIQD